MHFPGVKIFSMFVPVKTCVTGKSGKLISFPTKSTTLKKKVSSVRIHSIQFLIEFIRQYVQVKLLTLYTFPMFFHPVWHPAPALLGWYFWNLADEIQQPFHTPYWQVQLVLPLTVCQLNRHISSLYVLVESASLLIFVKHWNGRVLPRTHPCGADLSVQRNQEQATLDCVGFLFWSSVVYPASSVFYSPHLPAGNQYIFSLPPLILHVVIGLLAGFNDTLWLLLFFFFIIIAINNYDIINSVNVNLVCIVFIC